MRPIEGLGNNPILGYVENPNNPQDFGYSGIVVLYESHFAFHTWPYYAEIDFDIFSCKEFDFNKALKILQYFFKGKLVNSSLIGRGNHKTKIDIIKG